MKLKELEAEVMALRNEVQTLKDIEEIKTLQRAYGYYIEHYMTKEVGDCFADDPDVAVHLVGSGSYIGKKGIADWLSTDPKHMEPLFQHAIGSPEFYHGAMQLCPVIHVNPDGQTAFGRWYGHGEIAIPMKKGIFYQHWLGIYENEYLKQNGKWKIKILKLAVVYAYSPSDGLVEKERMLKEIIGIPQPGLCEPCPIKIEVEMPNYPSGYIVPFHYKHPVTGRTTSEKDWNSALNK